ncbi:MAG: hypothetical protein CMI53_03360 [Parcubacteria group bacterium]|nr:hypothetical protein [Parcubacteria group bacterium]|tara:strand:+ start:1790 stop:3163 length:1374 start_codon:yes stop_codon:yes gene_type:complete
MKIFILNPFLFTGKLKTLSRRRQPLGLAYIASLLRDKHEIRLLDANVLKLDFASTIEKIRKFKPDMLILTSTPMDRWEVPSHAHIKLLIDNLVNTINSVEIKHTILLGSHGTVKPEWILERAKVDYVIRGEPELTTVDLVNTLVAGGDTSNVAGISYVKDGQITNNPDARRNKSLDEMPYPAFDLLPMDKYSYSFPDIPKPFSLMITSRGCPFNCTYCLKKMMDKLYIVRSPESVVAEMKYLAENYGIKGIYFQDWEFLIIHSRVEKICDLIIEAGLDIKWGANARVSDLTDERVAKMKKAGCVRINIGFESGSQKVLDMAKKQVKMSETQNSIDICKKHNINIGAYSILNLPGETRQTIAETEKFLADNKIKTMCAPNLPIPYFGTEMYQMLKKQEGKDFDWENLEKYAGRVGVAQPPWLARIYRWHYKYKYNFGNFYFLKPEFYTRLVKFVRSAL